MNHPSLRYGGYHLLPLIFYIPLCLYLSNLKFDINFFKKRALILIIITLVIFLGRNISRLNEEYNQYNYNPFVSTKYKIDYDLIFKINKWFKINIDDSDGLSKYKEVSFIGKNFLIIKN